MIRTAVIGWLVAATLSGPWLCCCAAAAPARDRTADPAPAAPAKPKRSCCGHKKAADGPKKDAPPDRPHKAPCPCKESAAKASVVPQPPAGGFEFAAAAASGDTLPPCTDVLPPVAAVTTGLSPDATSQPTAEVLLHVFHNLRC
jgi:hypothetical protein